MVLDPSFGELSSTLYFNVGTTAAFETYLSPNNSSATFVSIQLTGSLGCLDFGGINSLWGYLIFVNVSPEVLSINSQIYV